MRIVSLVPSWTETLIEAGLHVVGRTRFCIHPHDKVKTIEVVGGTKSFDIEKIRDLKPDIILLDREENTKEMGDLAERISMIHLSHVESVDDMPRELRALALALSNTQLEDFAGRFERVLGQPLIVLHNDFFEGLLKWQTEIRVAATGDLKDTSLIQGSQLASTEFVYCIWKDPWMAAGRGTFISSMLRQVGFDLTKMWPSEKTSQEKSQENSDKYPTFNVTSIPSGALVLLSSEPFPFAKKPPFLPQKRVALVDGESFSWFGIRALRFLESAHGSDTGSDTKTQSSLFVKSHE